MEQFRAHETNLEALLVSQREVRTVRHTFVHIEELSEGDLGPERAANRSRSADGRLENSAPAHDATSDHDATCDHDAPCDHATSDDANAQNLLLLQKLMTDDDQEVPHSHGPCPANVPVPPLAILTDPVPQFSDPRFFRPAHDAVSESASSAEDFLFQEDLFSQGATSSVSGSTATTASTKKATKTKKKKTKSQKRQAAQSNYEARRTQALHKFNAELPSQPDIPDEWAIDKVDQLFDMWFEQCGCDWDTVQAKIKMLDKEVRKEKVRSQIQRQLALRRFQEELPSRTKIPDHLKEFDQDLLFDEWYDHSDRDWDRMEARLGLE